MKIIVDKTTKVAKYSLGDSVPIILDVNHIIVGSNPVLFYVADMNSSNSILYEDVKDTPSDFIGTKYIYDGKAWTKNSNYIEPKK